MNQKEKILEVRRAFNKIVVNISLGRLRSNSQFEEKLLPEVMKEAAILTGQKPAVRKAKKSIAGFKTRTGDIIGLQTTLRGKKMFDFFERVINIALPRVKDFRGLEIKSVDGSGNLNIGFKEQFVFPEVNMEQSKVNFGLQVTIVPNTRNRDKAIVLYKSLAMPFKK